MGLRAESLRIDAAMLAQAGAAGLLHPNALPALALPTGSGAHRPVAGDKDLPLLADTRPIVTPAEFVDRFMPCVHATVVVSTPAAVAKSGHVTPSRERPPPAPARP